MPSRLRWLHRTAAALQFAAFAAFFAFVVASNDFDWDHFLSATEIDRRSWMLNGEAPLWSYQLCGGVTRAGDPQASGLSPLFVWVLAWGAFWGLKTAWLALAVLGHRALASMLEIFFRATSGRTRVSPTDRLILRTVSLAFVLGNYYVWHAHQGHFTFALGWLALAVVGYLLTAYTSGFRERDGVLAAFLAWGYLSAGFYHSLIFFLLPMSVALIGGIAVTLLGQRLGGVPPGGSLAGLGKMVVACALGFGVALYKPLWVLEHQQVTPRTVPVNAQLVDGSTFLQTAMSQLLPTVDYHFLGGFPGWLPWGIWEKSAFTLNSWLCVAAAVAFGVGAVRPGKVSGLHRSGNARRSGPYLRSLGLLLAALLVTAWTFAVGEQWPVSAHRLLNHFANNSIRVAGRYQVLFALAFAWGAAMVLGRSRAVYRAYLRFGVAAVPLLLCLNLLTFWSSLRPAGALPLIGDVHDDGPEMRQVGVAKERSNFQSFMYAIIRRGDAVLNCYDPIARETRMSRERVGRPELMSPQGKLRAGLVLPLIDTVTTQPLPVACLQGSHFTQNTIVLDASCPPGTCVNLNGLNVYRAAQLALDPDRDKYCRAER